MKPVTALELYRATPKTNCKACGFQTCLAFATRVIVEKKPLDTCPYLNEDDRSELTERIEEQQKAEIYTKRDLYKITADYIRERLGPYDLSSIAAGLGAESVDEGGRPFLSFSYLHRECLLSKERILIAGRPAEDHWDNILLYNYVCSAGQKPITGEWIPIDAIPGHIPKKPELENGCEKRIGDHFAGSPHRLRKAGERLGGKKAEDASHADMALCFLPLPKVPFYLIFWDCVPDEGFPAKAKVLFDRSVTHYLDIESLVFLAERFAKALIEADRP
jgi:hypothetical protein